MLKSITYKQSGVDYQGLDPVKILAQKAAQKTVKNLENTGFQEVGESRGASAYVVDLGDAYLASITECLGTKALVADQVRQLTGKTHYDAIAQDTIAMAVNDILTVGAKPVGIHAYWAAGDGAWFKDQPRIKDLISGWQHACELSGAAWGGGETPVLKGVIQPDAIDLAASCTGMIKPKSRLTLGNKLQVGDAIILLKSSGIHANGLTLARKLAGKLKNGYATGIDDNLSYGEALLKPTLIYAQVIDALFTAGIDLHYLSNITGHGWLKLMRHPNKFTYRIDSLPPVPKVLKFIVDQTNLSDQEAYTTFNMGAGFALFIPEKDANKTLKLSKQLGIKAYLAGQVINGPKQVILKPLNLNLEGKQLHLRA